MAIVTRGKNLEMTDALRKYTEQKIGRIEKYFDQGTDSDIVVTLSVIHDEHIVEVNVTVEGQYIRAQGKSGDMYASIDLVEQKLERQIRKYKTRIYRKDRKQSLKNDVSSIELPAYEEDETEVVRVKRFDFKPMDTEEAILQMNLLGHRFFVYQDERTKVINVVYKRHDGRYGLIVAD